MCFNLHPFIYHYSRNMCSCLFEVKSSTLFNLNLLSRCHLNPKRLRLNKMCCLWIDLLRAMRAHRVRAGRSAPALITSSNE